jgi:hypothetical protein
MEPYSDTQLDQATCEALGANTPEESAAYQSSLAADPAARRLDRALRETTARLAAASPHMKPSPDLRGRILEATAPKTFKMEDYRKVTREDYRFYKWGFYAAAMFLIFGALYNLDTRGKLDTANKNIALLQQQGQQLAAKTTDIITTFARGEQISWKDENGKLYGKAVVDMDTRKAILIFPQETIPATAAPQLTLNLPDQNRVTFNTTLITATAGELRFAVPQNADIGRILTVTNLKPDTNNIPQTAGMFHP